MPSAPVPAPPRLVCPVCRASWPLAPMFFGCPLCAATGRAIALEVVYDLASVRRGETVVCIATASGIRWSATFAGVDGTPEVTAPSALTRSG